MAFIEYQRNGVKIMLFSQNLIQTNNTTQGYNTAVNQINKIQREESKILNDRLDAYNDTTAKIDKVTEELLKSRVALVYKIKTLECLVYWS